MAGSVPPAPGGGAAPGHEPAEATAAASGWGGARCAGGLPSRTSLGQGWLCTAHSSGSRKGSLGSIDLHHRLHWAVGSGRPGSAWPICAITLCGPAHLEAGVGDTCTLAALRPQRPHSCTYSHHICPLSGKNAPETQAATFLLGEAVCMQDGGTSPSGVSFHQVSRPQMPKVTGGSFPGKCRCGNTPHQSQKADSLPDPLFPPAQTQAYILLP